MNFKRILFFTFHFSFFILFIGCDKITNPIKVVEQNSVLPNTKPDYTDSSTNYKIYKLLLEDCTGHFCVNCPTAAAIGDSLISVSNRAQQIVMMQDNIGFFADPRGTKGGPAAPAGVPSYAFKADYRCQAGNDWGAASAFDIVNASLPVGMISRIHYSASSPASVQISYPNWDNVIDSLLSATTFPAVEINMHDSCWVAQRIIGVEIQVNVITPLTGSYYIEPVIVEDSIIDWQMDNSPQFQKEGGYDSVFVHRNVLRGAFNLNSWGDLIPATVTSAASSYTKFYTYNFATGENGKAAGWNMKHCYIIAFVYNAANYNVVQAEMIKVE